MFSTSFYFFNSAGPLTPTLSLLRTTFLWRDVTALDCRPCHDWPTEEQSQGKQSAVFNETPTNHSI